MTTTTHLAPVPADRRTLLTTAHASQVTGLRPGTLANLRSAGKGPRFVRLGSAVRYLAGDLADWIESSAVLTVGGREPTTMTTPAPAARLPMQRDMSYADRPGREHHGTTADDGPGSTRRRVAGRIGVGVQS